MLRFFALPAVLALLSSCQMTDTGSTTPTRELRLARSQAVIDDCAITSCARLNLDSQLVEDYPSIARMGHVTALMVSYTDFNALSDIATMSQLRELHMGSTSVTDLSGLSNFPNLRLLHIQGIPVDDYSALSGLTRLEELALGWGEVGDLSYLRPLAALKSLSLDGATITSFAGLRRHPSLERLDLTNAALPEDISALRTLPNLQEISLSDWNLTDEQTAVIGQLQAAGVTVDYAPVVVVC